MRPGEVCSRSPLPGGRVDLRAVASGYIDSGSGIVGNSRKFEFPLISSQEMPLVESAAEGTPEGTLGIDAHAAGSDARFAACITSIISE